MNKFHGKTMPRSSKTCSSAVASWLFIMMNFWLRSWPFVAARRCTRIDSLRNSL